MKIKTFIGLWILLLIVLMSCSNKTKTTIRVGSIPGEDRQKAIKRLSPLIKYLGKELKTPCTLVIPDSYSHALKLFHEGKLDLVNFEGFSFVKAYTSSQAVPLVMRKVDSQFVSYFIKKADHLGENITDFKGQTLSFSSRLSTAGHLMARHYLKKQGIVPETFFKKVLYSGSHDKTAYWVRDGKVDLGAMNSLIFDRMVRDGLLQKQNLKVIFTTPPYSDNIWVVHPNINPSLRMKLKNAFLHLSVKNASHKKILDGLSAKHYIEASVENYEKLTKTINNLRLLQLTEKNTGKKPLIFGIHPYISTTEIFMRFTPLANYISQKVGRPVIIKISSSYDNHIDLVGKDKLDIAYIGPASYIKMVNKYGKKRLLASFEVNNKTYSQGKIIVQKYSPIKSISDLIGKRFAFVNKDSTMGHVVPRAMLIQSGVTLGNLRSIQFLGTHNDVALAVLVGDFDAGAVEEEVFNKYKWQGLKALTTTPSIYEHLFVANPKLSPKTIKLLRKTLLSLKNSDEGKSILTGIKKNTTALIIVKDRNYDKLRGILSVLRKKGIQ